MAGTSNKHDVIVPVVSALGWGELVRPPANAPPLPPPPANAPPLPPPPPPPPPRIIYPASRLLIHKHSHRRVGTAHRRRVFPAGNHSHLREDQKYIQASNVNVSNFVSVKLSLGGGNYDIWKIQMLALIDSQMLRHIIDPYYPDDEKDVHMIYQYNTLVKGWILGSMNEKLISDHLEIVLAKKIWENLEDSFNSAKREVKKDNSADTLGFSFTNGRMKDLSEAEDPSKFTVASLYEAAVEGCWWKAKSILKNDKKAATQVITRNGNTILHLAVEMGQNHFVEKLLEFLKDGKDIETKNYHGQTALHIAAVANNQYAAQLLVQKRIKLLDILDNKGDSPLDSAYSNRNLDVSSYLLKASLPSYLLSYADAGGQGGVTIFILSAILSKQYDLALAVLQRYTKSNMVLDYIFNALAITFPCDLGYTESFIYPSFHNVRKKTVLKCSLLFHSNILDRYVDDILRVGKIFNSPSHNWFGKNSVILLVPVATLYPIYQLICLLILMLRLTFSILYLLLWKVLVVTVTPIKNIEKKKKDYKEANEILRLVCNLMDPPDFTDSSPIFEAVLIDAHKVVDEILYKSPNAITFTDDEGYNIIQLAIINRSEKVYNLLHHIIERVDSYRTMKDFSTNNLVHLAGRLAPSYVLSRTTGAALQLQRELLWQQEVEKLMLPSELTKENRVEETPAEVFTREHKGLLKEGETWMKTTAESCSITAALIVTIVFAAAITVPGGSNQESGVPVFRKEIAFTVFALSNAFSLFTAATSLLLFLSILTARFSEKDFLVGLPRRLIFGLLTLFLSTTSMMAAFGAILYLVFCDQRPWMLAPIAVFACLPISVIVTIKVPLLVDLIQSTYIPIFGNKSYLDTCKTNRKYTVFTE